MAVPDARQYRVPWRGGVPVCSRRRAARGQLRRGPLRSSPCCSCAVVDAQRGRVRCGAAFAGKRGPPRAVARGWGARQPIELLARSLWLLGSRAACFRTAVRPVLAWWRSASGHGGSAGSDYRRLARQGFAVVGPPLCGSASRAREPMAGSLGRSAQAQRTCAARRGVCWPAGTVCSAR